VLQTEQQPSDQPGVYLVEQRSQLSTPMGSRELIDERERLLAMEDQQRQNELRRLQEQSQRVAVGGSNIRKLIKMKAQL